MRNKLLIAALVLVSQPAFAEGGWTRAQGAGYAKLGLSTFRSASYYTLDGVLREGNTFSQSAASFYGEYGLIDELTAIVYAPFFALQSFSNTDFVAGVQDVRLELKGGLAAAGFSMALSIAAELPTGRSVAFVADREIPGARINLPLGDGELSFWATFAVSRSLAELSAYATIFAAYGLRTSGFSDQVLSGLELGHQLFDAVWLRARLRLLQSTRATADATVPFIYGEGSEYLAGYFGASLPIGAGFSIDAEYGNALALRKNVYGGSRFELGVAYSF